MRACRSCGLARAAVVVEVPLDMHPQTRLGYEILPYLRELDDHEWTAEEREFLWGMERLKGRPLEEWEKRMAVAQARMIGDL